MITLPYASWYASMTRLLWLALSHQPYIRHYTDTLCSQSKID